MSLTPLQTKALKSALKELERSSKYTLKLSLLEAVKEAVPETAPLYRELKEIIDRKIEAHDDGKAEAREWIQTVMQS